jgi:hypothetical protein
MSAPRLRQAVISFETLADDRLDRANLNRLTAVGSLVDALHHTNAIDALGFERGDGLVD